MDSLKFNLKARGEFLKILLLVAIAVFICLKAPDKVVVLKKSIPIAGKIKTIKVPIRPEIAQGVAGISILCALYLILLTKTTQVDAGRINFSLSRGLLVRSRDAMDITGITDFQKERTLLDMVLGISRVRIFSRDKTHPVLLLRGVANREADLFYDHITAYSNKSMVEYVQGHGERTRYNQKRNQPTDTKWDRKKLIDDGDDEPNGSSGNSDGENS